MTTRLCWPADGESLVLQGNKGTTFVLVKDQPLKEQLLAALDSNASDAQIQRLAEDLVAAGGGVTAPARSEALPGAWLSRWALSGGCSDSAQVVRSLVHAPAGNCTLNAHVQAFFSGWVKLPGSI
ncbi:hypothetical protein MMC29_000573 [Sticta canariensis]|nr:hypothetical protein [Sticta canariensis]